MSENKKDPIRGVWVSKLTPELTATVVQNIHDGATIETAANAAGVHRSTLNRWLRDGKDALNRHPVISDDLREIEDPDLRDRAAFVTEIEQALSTFKLDLTKAIQAHGKEAWQALGWMAERRFPQEFGRRTRHEHVGEDGGPLRVLHGHVDLTKLTGDELDTLIELARKAQPDTGADVIQLPRAVDSG